MPSWFRPAALAAATLLAAAMPAAAAILAVEGPLSRNGLAAAIIPAPPSVLDNAAGAGAMLGFDEVLGLRLPADLAVDGGVIRAGTRVSSHMIFLDGPPGERLRHGTAAAPVVWRFDGRILGVMSDTPGLLEAASSPLLGHPATLYTGGRLSNRGLEENDGYALLGPDRLALHLGVRGVGDWVRVITAAPAAVPLPAALGPLALALGLIGLGLGARRRARRAP